MLVAAGRTRVVARAFDLGDDRERFLPGVLSRKKQVAAAIARSLAGG